MKLFVTRIITCAGLALIPASLYAGDLSPRAEVNVRAGTERSILMTEFWAPLAQQNERVLYGDLRLMGDDGDNREGNLGFGYRQLSSKTNSVLGGNIWIDRRRTENGNNFHQLTLGLESLGDTIDLRANGYIQLNSAKTIITPNIGNANPYLAGNGIFYDTNGFIIEEPQHGFDAEVGYRLPVLQKYIDATRVYAGGYHFWGDQTNNVTGFRLRTEAQVNSIFSVGARFQHDSPRGSQGFLEATLRFPFKSKKLYQEHGLRSRLDESPERDIDIVTGSKVDNGLMKPVINEASGTQQRILYVDNTNTNAGDGSKDNPFNTLAAAQAALRDNDIVYINRGDGTTTGMDQGIHINKDNIQLIGSGSDLSYGGFTLLSAGLAPTITNITAPASSADLLVGNGVLITSSDAFVSGITITNAAFNGIRILADGTHINSATVTNVTASNNNSSGIIAQAINNGTINSLNFLNNLASDNKATASTSANGIGVAALTGGWIGTVNIIGNTSTNNDQNGILASATAGSIDDVFIDSNSTNNNKGYGVIISGAVINSVVSNLTTNSNVLHGVYAIANANSTMNTITLKNINALNNTQRGISVVANNGTIGKVDILNVTANSNGQNGIHINALANGTIGDTTIDTVTTSNNIQSGIRIDSTTNTSILNKTSITNVVSDNNTLYGIIVSSATGFIGQVNLDHISTNNNNTGLWIQANGTASTINQITLSNITTTNNTASGVYVYANGGGAINKTDMTRIVANNNTQHGIYVYSSGTSLRLSDVSLSYSDTTGNGVHGVYILSTNASVPILADLGGGALNSAGQNRIYGNVGNDIRLSYVAGGSVSARNNWWGVSTAPTRVMLSASTTLDSTGFLTTNPRP